MTPEELVLAHTVVAATPLVPELRLHLVTHECALWHATEEQAAAAHLDQHLEQQLRRFEALGYRPPIR